MRFLRAENTRLKAERATAAAAALFSPNDPLMRRGKARSTVALSAESHGFTNDVDNRANEKTPAPPEDTHALSRVKQAARQLARQVSLIAASPRVIDLTRMPPATNRKWWSWRDDPRVQKWDEEEKGRHLLTRGMALRAQIQQTVRSRSASLVCMISRRLWVLICSSQSSLSASRRRYRFAPNRCHSWGGYECAPRMPQMLGNANVSCLGIGTNSRQYMQFSWRKFA